MVLCMLANRYSDENGIVNLDARLGGAASRTEGHPESAATEASQRRENDVKERAPITREFARFIANFAIDDLPDDVRRYAGILIFDGIGTTYAAVHPSVSSGVHTRDFAQEQAGPKQATLIGRGRKVSMLNAVLANGTLGYAADFEPHHPEAILHPVAVLLPAALAVCENVGASGSSFLGALALGCEVTYRVSMAMNPRSLYARGFHPSAVCGAFGAAAAASNLMRLDEVATTRALGLAALQASGLMAWQDDPKEDARPFQMGMAARNGITAALLAQREFGAPDRIFDGGHTVLAAFSDDSRSERLLDGLGRKWNGVAGLAVKPYPCVSFLHPALDALANLLDSHDLASENIEAINLRFAESGCHCIDDNPLKGHSAQYILPVFAATGRLRFNDLFDDLRQTNSEVARLANSTMVQRDRGAFEESFPSSYSGEISLKLADGRLLSQRRNIARGYPGKPMATAEIEAKFEETLRGMLGADRISALAEASRAIDGSKSVQPLAAQLELPPDLH